MTYRTIMLHLALNYDNRAVLAAGADLARRHEANVIGIAAAQPAPPITDNGYYSGVSLSAEFQQLDREQIGHALAACEKQFRNALRDNKGDIEWRSTVTTLALPAWLSEQARAADLIVTGPTRPFSAINNGERVNIGALALAAGRPLLVVPPAVEKLSLRNVLVAWKDSREARRVVVDALPLLLEAESVTVLAVAGLDELKPIQACVEDVLRWLGRHGVHAVAQAVVANAQESRVLGEEITGRAPDLVVAGAYGHSRLNEWVFGGVTKDILLSAGCCVLLSH